MYQNKKDGQINDRPINPLISNLRLKNLEFDGSYKCCNLGISKPFRQS